jgi:sortase B
MQHSAMFGDIGLFVSQEFFDSRKYGNLFFNDSDHGLEFFAFIETSGYNWEVFNPAVQGRENQQAYLDNILYLATHTRDIGVTVDDNIVLLATCTSDFVNGRHLLAAKLHDEPFENPFAEDEEAAAERSRFVDGQLLPFLRTICMPALLLAVILVMIYWNIQRRRRWDTEDKWALIESNPALLKKLEDQGLVGEKADKVNKGKKTDRAGVASKVSETSKVSK